MYSAQAAALLDVEAYLDIIDLVNDSHSDDLHPIFVILSPGAPTNPFNQCVNVVIPLPGFDASVSNGTHMLSGSDGLIITLPLGWRGNMDYSRVLHGSTLSADFYTAVTDGTCVRT